MAERAQNMTQKFDKFLSKCNILYRRISAKYLTFSLTQDTCTEPQIYCVYWQKFIRYFNLVEDHTS